MDLPETFQHNITNAFGEEGRQWLQTLPSRLEQAAAQWDLVIGQPMLLSYNYVTAAKLRAGGEVVLKIGVPNPELLSEIHALRQYNGDGCVRLLAVDEASAMFLLERLRPGNMLAGLENDEQRTRIACDVLSHLWRPARPELPFIRLQDWFEKLSGIRSSFGGGTGPFPRPIVEFVETTLPQLFQGSAGASLIHGDFHHFNILSSERGWLAIDPKGVIGPREYDCGPFLINPMPGLPYLPDAVKITQRRIAILSEQLGFPRDRIRAWGICHALLSAWWDTTPEGTGGEYSLACAEVISRA